MRTLLVALALVSFAFAGCTTRPVHRPYGPPYGVGPPPHAPAHGYRHRLRSGAELRFDRNLEVYVVIGRPDLYWYLGRFLHFRAGRWEASAGLGGPWSAWPDRSVPWGLRKAYRARHVAPGRAKKRR